MSRKSNPKESHTTTLLDGWRNLFSPSLSLDEKVAQGKEMRKECPRTGIGKWKPASGRPSPLALLATQDQSRVEHLVPYKYGRMMQSPFAFFRGSALVMASDLSRVPRTRVQVQLCGDCHLSNFGIFGTHERNVIFDLNDFDETLPGPFEWDVKRLAASFAVAAETNGFSIATAERCVAAVARVYRKKMEAFARMRSLDVWYERVDWEYLVNKVKQPRRRETAAEALANLKSKSSHSGALAKLTEVVDGKRRIKDKPPLIYHSDDATREAVKQLVQAYATSLWESRRRLLERYRFVDVASKVVGVGSVGTAAGMVLLQGEGGDDDFIFLQVKQANRSVLENYLGASQFDHPGNRIVNGQRLLQSASDMFLGWGSGPKRAFYVRQLMDLKASVPVSELDAVSLEQYAEVCAYVLARGHARSGDPAVIHGYLGKSETFDEAVVKFAIAYAKQNEIDYLMLLDAIKKGKIQAEAVD